MKKALTCAVALAVLTLSSPAWSAAPKPAPTGNMIGLSTENGRIAYDFIDLWFNQRQPEAAFDKYVARSGYMNHSMVSKNTVQTFESQKAEETRVTPPNARFEFKQLVAQGDLVFAHIHAFGSPNPLGDEMVIILRVRQGKVVDHWDLHTPIKPDSNVFEGLDR